MARILEAALDALASDPEASMAEIARRAGLVRATIYVHFPTRESLIEAVTERAIAEVTQAMAAAEPDRGDPAEALQRLLATAWRELGRFHALVGINAHQPPADLHRLHRPVFAIASAANRTRPTHRHVPIRCSSDMASLDAAGNHPHRQRRGASQPTAARGDRVCARGDGARGAGRTTRVARSSCLTRHLRRTGSHPDPTLDEEPGH